MCRVSGSSNCSRFSEARENLAALEHDYQELTMEDDGNPGDEEY